MNKLTISEIDAYTFTCGDDRAYCYSYTFFVFLTKRFRLFSTFDPNGESALYELKDFNGWHRWEKV